MKRLVGATPRIPNLDVLGLDPEKAHRIAEIALRSGIVWRARPGNRFLYALRMFFRAFGSSKP